MFGILLGALFGAFFPEIALKQKVIGTVFVYFLKMLVVPLVFSSIVISILGLGSVEHLKRMGIKTIGLYMFTTALAVFSAILAMNIFSVGEKVAIVGLVCEKATALAPFSFENMILSFIPTNVFGATASRAQPPNRVGSLARIVSWCQTEGPFRPFPQCCATTQRPRRQAMSLPPDRNPERQGTPVSCGSQRATPAPALCIPCRQKGDRNVTIWQQMNYFASPGKAQKVSCPQSLRRLVVAP